MAIVHKCLTDLLDCVTQFGRPVSRRELGLSLAFLGVEMRIFNRNQKSHFLRLLDEAVDDPNLEPGDEENFRREFLSKI